MEVRLPYFEVIDVMTTAPPEIPYGVKMIGAELEWAETRQGEGIKVAVLDTGRPMHPDIIVAGSVDFTGTGAEDKHGHSTHCCGIIAANGKIKGVAPKVKLYTVKVLDNQGRGDYNRIISGIRWCIANGMDVISMSLGGPPPTDNNLRQAIQDAYNAGIVVVAAAGNFGRDIPAIAPAIYPEVISVAAVDVHKIHADWSSWHETVELASAGVEIYSTYLGGTYAKLSGTSMACPHITGAVALMISKRRFRKLNTMPEFIRDSMAVYADDLGEKGRDIKYGYGLFTFGRIDDTTPTPDRPPIDLKFEVGKKHYWRNGLLNSALTAPRIMEDDRTYLGIRDVGMAFGCDVLWEAPFIYIRG